MVRVIDERGVMKLIMKLIYLCKTRVYTFIVNIFLHSIQTFSLLLCSFLVFFRESGAGETRELRAKIAFREDTRRDRRVFWS